MHSRKLWLNSGTAVCSAAVLKDLACCMLSPLQKHSTSILYRTELPNIEFLAGKPFHCTRRHCTLRVVTGGCDVYCLHRCNFNAQHAAKKPPLHCAAKEAQASWHRSHISTLRNTTRYQNIFKHHKINLGIHVVRFCFHSHTYSTIEGVG